MSSYCKNALKFIDMNFECEKNKHKMYTESQVMEALHIAFHEGRHSELNFADTYPNDQELGEVMRNRAIYFKNHEDWKRQIAEFGMQ